MVTVVQTIKWTSRNDVPIASVAITYRWSPNTPWLLADHIANTGLLFDWRVVSLFVLFNGLGFVRLLGAYVFKVPDGVPPTSSFQLMVCRRTRHSFRAGSMRVVFCSLSGASAAARQRPDARHHAKDGFFSKFFSFSVR